MKIECGMKSYTPSRLFCIGRNYVEHIRELNNDESTPPVIFMKNASSLVSSDIDSIPASVNGFQVHYETELVVLVGRDGYAVSLDEAPSFIAGLGVGLDLTLRDLQNGLMGKGLPWEASKAFDASAPIGCMTPFNPAVDKLDSLTFTGSVNSELRQRGDSALMIYPVARILVEISRYWQLRVGDLIYTGTPAGVGPLGAGDKIEAVDHRGNRFSWEAR